MACGGFRCTRNSLIALNILYIMVGFILVAVATYGQSVNHLTNISFIGGIIGCGVFLLLIAVLGLIGATKHHQVLLFFYMVILFVLFVIQFGIACACLAITQEQQYALAKIGWTSSTDEMKTLAQTYFTCCSFDHTNSNLAGNTSYPVCPKCCPENYQTNSSTCQCPTCDLFLTTAIREGLKISGGIGLFFSFTEFVGVWLTVRYRNQKDPRSNPREFI